MMGQRHTPDLFVSIFKGVIMERERIQILIEVDLDPIPGWGNNPNDYVRLLERLLADRIPHYNPVVMFLPTDDRVLPARETEKSGP
jgi:hypothetical protein